MDNILNMTEDLKNEIMNSKEYKDYLRINKTLDNNKEINKIINEIKKLQKKIVNEEVKNTKSAAKEKDLKELFDKLYSYEEYKEYIKISKKLNKLLSKIQKNFEVVFNDILV